MARKALLIGCQTKGLQGVDNDIESMAAALDRWGFASTRCEAANATRTGILEACERLIVDAQPSDAIVVYYSGHGGYCRPREMAPGRPRSSMQFIVPWDIDDSAENDFRGIMSVELSVLLARLTDRTRNVTVALDCCHAAHMARDDDRHLIPKALARPVTYETVANHFASLQLQAGRLGAWLPLNNPNAVRIVACAEEQSAYEVTNAEGKRTGLLTEALTTVFSEARADGLRVSWATVVDRVRQHVLSIYPAQRPEAEGPARRLLFDTTEADSLATLPVLVNGDRVELGGAALLGVRVGDEFTVMPCDSTGPDDETKVGDVVVDEVHATAASGVLKSRDQDAPVPLGARAYQRKVVAPTMPVCLPDSGMPATLLGQAVDLSPLLRAADPDDECAVEVRVDDSGGLTIFDQIGPLLPSVAADATGVDGIMRNLKRLAWANRLRCLAADPAHELDTPIELEFGIVRERGAEPLPVSGGIVYAGQRIYIRIRNKGNDRVYVSLLDIGVSSRVSILNPATPGGELVGPGEETTLGWNVHRQVLEGAQVNWPDELARSSPRPETVIVLVTTQPQEIRGLEQDGLRGGELRPAFLVDEGPRSPLEQVLDQIDRGGQREITPKAGPSTRYSVHTIDFELVPTDPPVSESPKFQVDDRPEQSALLWSPRSAMQTSFAVRLADLFVHRNPALRGADVRLDAMVLTRGANNHPVWSAQTERFSDIGEDQYLPTELLLYRGPVMDYLDIAVWVTRDAPGSLALADLMREKLTSNNIRIPTDQADDSLLTATPETAMAIAAIGARAVFINTTYDFLTGITGQSIGLYRTTLLAGERFGTDRPDEQCVVRAQDFSFRCLVEDIGWPAAVRQDPVNSHC